MAHPIADPTQSTPENSQTSPKTRRHRVARHLLAATAIAGVVLSSIAPLIASGEGAHQGHPAPLSDVQVDVPTARPPRPAFDTPIERLIAASAAAAELAPRLPNDPRLTDGSLWGLQDIGAPEAWARGTGSFQTTVAVVDTGVDYTHPDLYENIWINQGEIPAAAREQLVDVDDDGLITFVDLNADETGAVPDDNGNDYIDGGDLLAAWSDGVDGDGNGYIDDLIGWDFLHNDNDPLDEVFHGTHVAGTIGAIGDNARGVAGVNWRVQIMVLRNNTWSFAGMAEALRYAVDNGARISNHSYGVPSFADDEGGTPEILEAAIAYAEAQGHIVVTSAGNGEDYPVDPLEVQALGNNTDFDIRYPASVRQPNLIAVAAVDETGRLTHFSNYGLDTVALAAPGLDILSTTPTYPTEAMSTFGIAQDYDAVSGTSMAAPHVVGALALVWDLHPAWSASQVIAAVTGSVTWDAGLDGRTTSGGTLNLSAAVAAN